MEIKRVKFKGKSYPVVEKVCRSCQDRIFCIENHRTLLERFAVAGEKGILAEADGPSKYEKIVACLALMKR